MVADLCVNTPFLVDFLGLNMTHTPSPFGFVLLLTDIHVIGVLRREGTFNVLGEGEAVLFLNCVLSHAGSFCRPCAQNTNPSLTYFQAKMFGGGLSTSHACLLSYAPLGLQYTPGEGSLPPSPPKHLPCFPIRWAVLLGLS